VIEYKNIFVFINHLYYGKIKWPFTIRTRCCPDAMKLRIRVIDNKGDVGFLRDCEPEWIFGYGSCSATEGRMFVLSIGLKAEYSFISNIVSDHREGNLNITYGRLEP